MSDWLRVLNRLEIPLFGIVHVGANVGQETRAYNRFAPHTPIMFIEPISSLAQQIREKIKDFPAFSVVEALCSDIDGATVDFNISSNDGASSSILPFSRHEELYPSITYVETVKMETVTLDTLLSRERFDANVIAMDTQGAELMVLRGSDRLLDTIDAVYSEVSEKPLYEGGCSLAEISAHLEARDFALRYMSLNKDGWGNALYIRRSPAFLDRLKNKVDAVARTSASSTFKKFEPERALNGDLNQRIGFQTKEDARPFWSAKFNSETFVKSCFLVNAKRFRERAASLRLDICHGDETWTPVYNHAKSANAGWATLNIPINRRVAGVRLLLQKPEQFHLRQVVFLG